MGKHYKIIFIRFIAFYRHENNVKTLHVAVTNFDFIRISKRNWICIDMQIIETWRWKVIITILQLLQYFNFFTLSSSSSSTSMLLLYVCWWKACIIINFIFGLIGFLPDLLHCLKTTRWPTKSTLDIRLRTKFYFHMHISWCKLLVASSISVLPFI